MPLSGLHVLDLSRYLPGPQTAALLGDFGAKVTRLQGPRHAEARDRALGITGLTGADRIRARSADLSGRNKETRLLDIFTDAGRAALLEMITTADVLIHDYRQATLDTAKIAASDLHPVNPGLIYVGISATGTSGPLANAPGHDPVALALSGAMSRTGPTPQFLGFPPADILTASNTAFAIMVALRHRDANPPVSADQGVVLDAAMSDSALSLMTSVFGRQLRSGTEPAQDFHMGDNWVFATSDKLHVVATNMERPFWDRFCDLVERPDLKARFTGGDRPALRAELQTIYHRHSRADWIALARDHDLQIAPVLSPAEALAHPHHHARGALVARDQDGVAITLPGRPVRVTGLPETTPRPAGDPT